MPDDYIHRERSAVGFGRWIVFSKCNAMPVDEHELVLERNSIDELI